MGNWANTALLSSDKRILTRHEQFSHLTRVTCTELLINNEISKV